MMQLLGQFKGLLPFSLWLIASLAAGGALFYGWHFLAKRAQGGATRDLQANEGQPPDPRASGER